MTEGHTPDLIERIEAATGPDRELDVAILTTVLGYRDIYGTGELFDRAHEEYWILDGTPSIPALPSPTGSIDAALPLVPDKAMCDGGWRVEYHHDLNKRCHATIWLHEYAEPGDGWFAGWGATPALAICAASLKARAVP